MKFSLHSLMSCLITLVIISISALMILHFRPLYYYYISSGEIHNHYSLSPEQIRENYDTLINYNSSFSGKELELPHLPSSENGLVHFREVRDIFILLNYVAISSILLIFIFDRLFRNLLKRQTYFLLGGIFTLSLTLGVGLFILIDFSSAFVLFHKIAFRNDLWIFDYQTDPIILYLPESFFMMAALLIVSLIILFSFLSLLLSIHFKKKNK